MEYQVNVTDRECIVIDVTERTDLQHELTDDTDKMLEAIEDFRNEFLPEDSSIAYWI